MSIIDSIYNGSYDGFPITIEGSTVTGGRKTSKKSYPNRDDQTIEDLGLQPRGYSMALAVYSNSPDAYFADRDALLEVLDKGGASELIHPYYGTLQNMAVISWSMEEENSRLGEGKLTVLFEPSAGTGIPEAAALTTSAVQTELTKVNTQLNTSFLDTFKVDISFFGNIQAAIGKVGDMVDSIEDSVAFIEDIADEANAFAKELTDLANDIVSLVQNPTQLLDSLNNVFTSINNLFDTPDRLFNAFENLFGFGDNDEVSNLPGRVQQQRASNSAALNSVMNVNSLSGAYNASIQINFETVNDIDSISNRLDVQYENLISDETLPVEVKNSIVEARVIVVEFFNQQRLLAAEIVNVHVETTSSRLISFEYYNNSSRGDEIADENNITDINFVEGDIRILSN